MRRSRVSGTLYALVLFMLPIIDVALLASFEVTRALSLLAIVAIVAYFIVPPSPWWLLTLLGAFWHDVYVLTPYVPSLLSVVALGVSLDGVTSWLTSRSYWTDLVMVASAYSAALAVELMVGLLANRFLLFVIPPRYGVAALVGIVVVSVGTAVWLSREAHRHLYVQ